MGKMPIFHFFADLANFDDKKIILRVLWSSKYSRITWYGYIRSHWDQKNDFQNFGSTPPLTAHCGLLSDVYQELRNNESFLHG